MSGKLMKLAKIYQELKESFDFENIQPYSWKRNSNFKYSFNNVIVEFEETDYYKLLYGKLSAAQNSYNVQYLISGKDTQAYRSDYRELIRILKTILMCVEDFIENVKPDILTIFSIDKLGKLKIDKQKDKIYFALTAKYLPNGYGHESITLPFGTGILLFKNTL